MGSTLYSSELGSTEKQGVSGIFTFGLGLLGVLLGDLHRHGLYF